MDAAGDIFLLAGSAIRKIDGVTGIITLIAGGYNDFRVRPVPETAAQPAAHSSIFREGWRSIRQATSTWRLLQPSQDQRGYRHHPDHYRKWAQRVFFRGPCRECRLWDRNRVDCGDSSGNIYFYLLNQGTVYRIDAVTTEMTQVVGKDAGFPATGIGGLALNARLGANNLVGLAFDSAGNLYIADQENAAVYQVSFTAATLRFTREPRRQRRARARVVPPTLETAAPQQRRTSTVPSPLPLTRQTIFISRKTASQAATARCGESMPSPALFTPWQVRLQRSTIATTL